jgi:hypothetical protein
MKKQQIDQQYLQALCAATIEGEVPAGTYTGKMAEDLEAIAVDAAFDARMSDSGYTGEVPYEAATELLRHSAKLHRMAGNHTRATGIERHAEALEKRANIIRVNREGLHGWFAALDHTVETNAKASYELADAFRFLVAQSNKRRGVENVFRALLLVAILSAVFLRP